MIAHSRQVLADRRRATLQQDFSIDLSLKRGWLRQLAQTARDIVLGATGSRELPGDQIDALKLEAVGVWGVTPAAYGLDCALHSSVHHHRSDLAVLVHYQMGWGKAA